MDRLAKLAICLTLLAAAAWGQTCSCPGCGLAGTNGDIPANVSVTTPYSGDPTKALISWTNTHNEYGIVQLTQQLYGVGSPDVDRIVNGPNSASTATSVVVNHLLPNGYLYNFNIATCPDALPNTSSCLTSSLHTSLFPAGNGESNGCQFTTANTSGSLTWIAMPFGAQDLYAGRPDGSTARINVGITSLIETGPAGCKGSTCGTMQYLVVTHADIDGTSCTVTSHGGLCGGGTGLGFQYLCDNSYASSTGTNNYDTFVFQNGPYVGQYFCSNSWFGQGFGFLSLTATPSAAQTTHTVNVTLTAINSSFSVLGTASMSYTYTVLAPATFTVTAPSSFSTAYLNGFDNLNAQEGTQFFNGFTTANTTLPGVYFNDNGSADLYTFLPWTIASYSGDAVAMHFSDYYGAVNNAFTASGSYVLGQKFCSNGAGGCLHSPNCVLVASNGGTAGGSTPACPAVGSSVVSGAVTFYNAGNGDYWLYQAQRLNRQVRDFYLDTKQYSFPQEWAIFPLGTFMDCLREYGTSCTSSSLDMKAIGYIGFPILSANGGQNQKIVFDYVNTPLGTIRSLPYDVQVLLTYWMGTGNYPCTGTSPTYPCNSGIDALQAMVDVLIQTGDAVYNNKLYDGQNQWTIACCLNYANFDIGLLVKADILVYDTEVYMAAHGWSGTPDARIPLEVMKIVDFMYSTQWAVSGNDSFAYEYGLVPNNTALYNNDQTNLNNLFAPAPLWLWTVYGDTCTLPTSGASCKTVAETIWHHTWDNVFTGSGKEVTQIGEWASDYIGWHAGTFAGTDSSFLPDQNPYYGSTWTNKFEPFPDGDFPSRPLCTPTSHTTANCVWYAHEQAATCKVWMGYTNSSLPQTFTGGSATFVGGTDSSYQCSLTATGIVPPSDNVLFYAVGGPDAQSNVAETEYNINDGTDYQITMPAGPSITITPTTLPNGTVGISYGTQVLTAHGGTAPYTWAITSCIPGCVGGNIPGLSFTTTSSTTAQFTGTPTLPGYFSMVVKATDSTLASGSQAYLVHILPGTSAIGHVRNGTIQRDVQR